MKIEVGNVKSRVIIGGKDNLLKVDLMKELQDYLRVRPSGYSFSPAYKRRQWDGWKRFITSKGYFATGFLPLVVGFCESHGAKVTIEDQRPRVLMLDKDNFNEDVRWWKMLPHQVEATKNLYNFSNGLPFPRGVFDCATNAGKNTVAAAIHSNLVAPDGKAIRTLFIVHNQEIYKQATDFFQGAGINCGGIKSGSYDAGGDMTVGMVKTMANMLDKKDMTFIRDLNTYDVVMIDEGHHAGASSYSQVMQACESASVRVILSGTALQNEDKVKNMVIVGLSGLTLAKIDNVEMFDAKVSLKPHVKVVLNPQEQGRMMGYDEECAEMIMESTLRMDAITEQMQEKKFLRTVVTFEEIAHGLFMAEYLEKKFPKLRVECTHGQDPHRTTKMQEFKDRAIDILVVSMIMQEGINMPGIQRIVMAHGGKSDIRNKQLAGRGMRKDDQDPDATTFELIDVWDQGAYTSKHSRKRVALYKKEGFEVDYLYKHKRGTPVKK